jgi:hypothetical protein
MFSIPVGFDERIVTEPDLRAAQAGLLLGTTTPDQRALIDACLSWVIINHVAIRPASTECSG